MHRHTECKTNCTDKVPYWCNCYSFVGFVPDAMVIRMARSDIPLKCSSIVRPLWMSDGGFWGLTRSQYKSCIHVTGPYKIIQDAANSQRALRTAFRVQPNHGRSLKKEQHERGAHATVRLVQAAHELISCFSFPFRSIKYLCTPCNEGLLQSIGLRKLTTWTMSTKCRIKSQLQARGRHAQTDAEHACTKGTRKQKKTCAS